MDEMYEIAHQATHMFFRIDEVYTNWWWMKCIKLVEYEFFQIGWNLNMNTPEIALSQF